MPDFPPILLAWLVGLLSGFLVSIPVGPINITIINEGAQRGFKWALLIGLGAMTMEVIYCSISFAGFARFFDSKMIKAAMELLSFMLMTFLGFKFLFPRSAAITSKSSGRVEEKLHPHSAFMIGFVRVLGNPGVLLLWISLAGAFASHDWVEDDWFSRAMCILGVGLGATTWFVLLSYLISLKHRQLSDKTLVRMSQFSGLFMLAIAASIGMRIIFMLHKHQAGLSVPLLR